MKFGLLKTSGLSSIVLTAALGLFATSASAIPLGCAVGFASCGNPGPIAVPGTPGMGSFSWTETFDGGLSLDTTAGSGFDLTLDIDFAGFGDAVTFAGGLSVTLTTSTGVPLPGTITPPGPIPGPPFSGTGLTIVAPFGGVIPGPPPVPSDALSITGFSVSGPGLPMASPPLLIGYSFDTTDGTAFSLVGPGPSVVPAPGALSLVALSLLALGLVGRRRNGLATA